MLPLKLILKRTERIRPFVYGINHLLLLLYTLMILLIYFMLRTF